MEKFNLENKIQKKEGIICRDFDSKLYPETFQKQVEYTLVSLEWEFPREYTEDLSKVYEEILNTLKQGGVIPIESSKRLKKPKDILIKLDRREGWKKPEPAGVWRPFLDIYGVRFVFQNEKEVKSARKIIENNYRMPKKLPYDVKTVRKVTTSTSLPEFSAIRMNIVFKPTEIRNGSSILRAYNKNRGYSIAEIQLLTREEKEIMDKTRLLYEEKNKKR